MFSKAFIPFRGYYSSPFAKWQGSLATSHPIRLGAETCRAWLEEKGVDPQGIDYVNYGATVAQPQIFYGGPWIAALTGCERTPGIWLSQACSTSTTAVYQAAMAVEVGSAGMVLNLMTDRLSNGPHTVWPNPNGPGGEVISENWVMDNFACDPWGGQAMVATADNVARAAGITKEELDAIAVRRYEQYLDGTADGRAFQKRYMRALQVRVSRKQTLTIEEDEGIVPVTAEGAVKLAPVQPAGFHSFATQTHPADGNAAILVTTRERARELAPDGPEVQVLSYGFFREEQGHDAGGPGPGGAAGPGAGRHRHRGLRGHQDPQPVRRERRLHGQGVRSGSYGLQQLRQPADLRAPAGPDRCPGRHRAHRGAGDGRRGLRPLHRVRRRRHRRLARGEGGLTMDGTELYPGFQNPLLGSPRRDLPRHVAIVGAGTIGPDIGYYFKSAIPGLTLTVVDVRRRP